MHVPFPQLPFPPPAQRPAAHPAATVGHPGHSPARHPPAPKRRPHGANTGAIQRTHLSPPNPRQRLHHQALRQRHLPRPHPRAGAVRMDILLRRVVQRTRYQNQRPDTPPTTRHERQIHLVQQSRQSPATLRPALPPQRTACRTGEIRTCANGQQQPTAQNIPLAR